MLRNDMRFIGIEEENEVAPTISTESKCPQCGGPDLNIESADVLGCQRIQGIDDQGNLVLDRPKFYTDESHFYLSCADCGYEPDVDVDDGEDGEKSIVNWLTENCEKRPNVDHAKKVKGEEP